MYLDGGGPGGEWGRASSLTGLTWESRAEAAGLGGSCDRTGKSQLGWAEAGPGPGRVGTQDARAAQGRKVWEVQGRGRSLGGPDVGQA